MESSSDLVATRTPDVVFRNIGSGSILVNLKTNEIFELNDTGAHVWTLLSESASTIASLSARVCEAFDVSRIDAETHVTRLLHTFEAQGLVRLHQ